MAEKKRYTFRLNEGTAEALKELAQYSRRSQSNMLEVLIETAHYQAAMKDQQSKERSENDVLLQHG